MVSSQKTLRLIAITLEVIGTLMLSGALLMLHSRIEREKKLDEMVFNTMKTERRLTIAALILISLAFVMIVVVEIEVL